MKYNPVIVIAAYNRPESLKRLLYSLSHSKRITDTKLIISIDKNDTGDQSVRNIANAFKWTFGEKEVICQEKRLGLKNHILQCGDLSIKYGSVIILEDDLFVSPFFHEYARQALEYYDPDHVIAGISLYSQPVEDITELPFNAINDGSDVYFMQFPSSWGQAWSADQWKAFRTWFDKKPNIEELPISEVILNWPASSWKKHFAAYLVATNKYFVYPRISLTSNFNDPGTNYESLINHDGQAVLRLQGSPYRFHDLATSFSVYDSYFELLPEQVRKLNPELESFSFEMDLYGNKNRNTIQTPYIITSKYARNPVRGFKRSLKPHDMNIIFNLEGDDLVLCSTADSSPLRYNTRKEVMKYKYFFTRHLPGINVQLFKLFAKYKIFSFIYKA
jgi:hypothetical protein